MRSPNAVLPCVPALTGNEATGRNARKRPAKTVAGGAIVSAPGLAGRRARQPARFGRPARRPPELAAKLQHPAPAARRLEAARRGTPQVRALARDRFRRNLAVEQLPD